MRSVTNSGADQSPIKKANLDEPLPLLTKKKPITIVEEDLTKKALLKFMKNRDVPLRLPNPGTSVTQNQSRSPSNSSYGKSSPGRSSREPSPVLS